MKVVLYGAGGHARVVLDAARSSGEFDVVAVIDDRVDLAGTLFDNLPVVGDGSAAPALWATGVRAAILGVGSVDVVDTRRNLFELLVAMGFDLPVVQHRSATRSSSAIIGIASVIFAGAVVNPGARVGANVIVNTGAIVEHDVNIGDHVHIAPGAHIAGGVTIGEGSHVGIGATVIQGVRVGSRVVIGAGAVVLRDVPDGDRVVGVPARSTRGAAESPRS